MTQAETDLRASSVGPDGTRVDVGFIGSGPRIFVALHTPPGALRAGVVICSPLHTAFSKNYRNEVVLARSLSRAGIAALRFHYRGQGHSDGDARDVTLTTLRRDAVEALGYLRAMTGLEEVGFMGCRLGGLVAAAAASERSAAPVALWDPVLDPAGYLREASRARVIGDLAGGTPSQADPKERLRRDGYVDIHGYPIHLELAESLEGRTLLGELGDEPRPILLIQTARTPRIRPEYARFLEDRARVGSPVAVRPIVGEIAWWFRGVAADRERVDDLAADAVTQTCDWLAAQLSVGVG